MAKPSRTVVIFLILLIVGVFWIFAWLPGILQKSGLPPGGKSLTVEMEGAGLPVPVRTFKATQIEFTDLLPTMGTIRGEREVELKFEANGVISRINFREGDLVVEGEVLATLDDREANLRLDYAASKVDTASAQLRLAQQRLSIHEELYRQGAIIEPKLIEAQIEVEQAESQVTTAEKEMELARNEITKTVLKAPMDGVMGTREVEVGEYMTPQTVVAALMDVQNVFVELGVIERDIERIRLGQKVKVTVDSLPSTTFQGTIDNLAPMIEGKSRTLTAKVKVVNEQGKLLPGMFARAEIAVFEKPNALVIPTSALRDMDGDGKFEAVFIVEREIARLKQVTLGYLTTDYAEIAQGVIEGEQVVTEARGPLDEGARVSLLDVEEAGIQRIEPAFPGKSASEE